MTLVNNKGQLVGFIGEPRVSAKQIIDISEEIRAKSRGGSATFIYATTETLGNISDYIHQKEMNKRRKELERVLNRRHHA
jgi:hypothetical protein